MTLSGKISVKAETIAHVVKELESISQKYDEIAQNFGKIAQLNYYSSEKVAYSSIWKMAIVVLQQSLVVSKVH